MSQPDTRVVTGWTAIARAAGMGSVDAAQRAAARNVDPLPVFVRKGAGRTRVAWAWASAVRDWVYRQSAPYPQLPG
jgi:hypothetical protein